MVRKRYLILAVVIIIALAFISCAPGNQRWDQVINPGHKAGFWAGIWHGFIIIVTFVISLFTDKVGIYEVHNTGWTYNLGFVIGLLFSLGGGMRFGTHKRGLRQRDWDKINERVEIKVRQGIRDWLDEADKKEKEKGWEEIANRIEEKIKKALREWADR